VYVICARMHYECVCVCKYNFFSDIETCRCSFPCVNVSVDTHVEGMLAWVRIHCACHK
jgi:hypothetical protein